MYYYSERPGTLAAKRYEDDVPLEVKKRRLYEIVETQNRLSVISYKADIGKTFKVLIEAESKKSDQEWKGRTGHNKVMIFPKENYELKKGDYAFVKVTDCTQATLFGRIVDSPQSADHSS
jgi:tRNA-2-methylthio-N6-dimethylallyladenosine synthase